MNILQRHFSIQNYINGIAQAAYQCQLRRVYYLRRDIHLRSLLLEYDLRNGRPCILFVGVGRLRRMFLLDFECESML